MKKRVLCLVLTLVMMLGMVPVAHAGIIADDCGEATVITYYEAMARYDKAMNTPSRFLKPDNVFLDPHEAWEHYLATEPLTTGSFPGITVTRKWNTPYETTKRTAACPQT